MNVAELAKRIDPGRKLIIQTHNYPDHDAVAAGFGLQKLFQELGISSSLCYDGQIQSNSLEDMIRILEIPIEACRSAGVANDTQIVLVDGFMGNRNVTDLSGDLVGIIDHHKPSGIPAAPYSDIRADYGSCSTIIYEYFKETGLRIDRNTATALLMGIMMDTAFLTRGVSSHDLEAFSALFFIGDWEIGSTLLKNSISLRDLPVFQEAINSSFIEEDACFVFIDKECSTELIAIVADFFLRLREIRFVVVVNGGSEEYKLSVRSEDRGRPADFILQKALAGIGAGGGHVFMGGGSIPRGIFPGKKNLLDRFLTAMHRNVR